MRWNQFNIVIKSYKIQRIKSFFKQNSIANDFLYLDNKIINEKNVSYTVKLDANIIVAAFQLHQFTAFDFYRIFVDFYHTQQIQKCEELGKNTNSQRYQIDLQYFFIYLSVETTLKEWDQINYKQKGKLKLTSEIDDNQEVSWEDQYYILMKMKQIQSIKVNYESVQLERKYISIQDFFVADYTLFFLKKYLQHVNEKQLIKSLFSNRNRLNLTLENFSGSLELLKHKLNQFNNIKQKLIQVIKLQNNQKKIQMGYLFKIQYFGFIIFQKQSKQYKFQQFFYIQCSFTLAKIENSNWINQACKEIVSLIGGKKMLIQLSLLKMGLNQFQVLKMELSNYGMQFKINNQKKII
ncbi:unnamed protein product [Paramecium sonneborni]|uniref:Uncharacterized protein n=1 Tax=Paramecium sonneborni TaxID=65129 RepID=A0A8S1RWL2_9CILI|nr:unnamed protein product [Paramecium sonneborni]